MKTINLLALLLAFLNGALLSAQAQGTAFTYQGRLNDNGAPASALYDLRFKLFVDPLGNNQAGSAVVSNGVAVANGLFTVTLDFGRGIFNGGNYWLEVDVKTNGAGAYVDLSPLQAVTPAPYAIFAANIGGGGLAGTYGSAVTFNNAANQFTGTFTGNGAGLTNVNATTLGGLGATSFWRTGGNTGTSPASGNFIGTTDNQPLELRVNGLRALRLEPPANGPSVSNTVNVVNGAYVNFVSNGIVGATIGGGGAGYYFGGNYNTNSVTGEFGTVAGGLGNSAGRWATVSGGSQNYATGYTATVGGGLGNRSSGYSSFVGGGYANNAVSDYTTVAGGYKNKAAYTSATVGGGYRNLASGNFNGGDSATVAGGYQNAAVGNNAVVAGGALNYAQGDNAAIGGGWNHTNLAFGGFIGGGQYNSLQAGASLSTIGGGSFNSASSNYATIGGGTNNAANGDGATVSGGSVNGAAGAYATVPGGIANYAGGIASFAAGWNATALHDHSFVWSDGMGGTVSSTANNQFLIRASGGVGIGTVSPLAPLHIVGSGAANLILQDSTYGNYWNIYTEAFNASGALIFFPSTFNGVFGYIRQSDAVYVSASDERLKRDITPIGEVLDRVLQLRPVSYHFRAEPANTQRSLGLIAQEVEPLFPEAVGECRGMKGLAYSELVPVTIRAVQELNQKVDSENAQLKKELNRRDTENAGLKQRLEALEKIIGNNPIEAARP